MNILLVAPMGLVLTGLAGSWFLPHYVRPALCVRLLVGAMGAATVATAAGLMLIVLASVGEVPLLARLVGWCQLVYPETHGSSVLAGLAATLMLGFAGMQLIRRHRHFRADLSAFSGAQPLEVVRSDRPIAFAVPGDPGTVVVSSSLLTALDRDERNAVLAHEQAHLDDHHHRYVQFASLCVAAFPFLAPVGWRVRFLTERWADERAAAEVGSREVVARAIARVGLSASGGDTLSLDFSGRSSIARVRALTSTPKSHGLLLPVAVSCVVLGGVVLGSSLQLHHLAALAAHLCGV